MDTLDYYCNLRHRLYDQKERRCILCSLVTLGASVERLKQIHSVQMWSLHDVLDSGALAEVIARGNRPVAEWLSDTFQLYNLPIRSNYIPALIRCANKGDITTFKWFVVHFKITREEAKVLAGYTDQLNVDAAAWLFFYFSWNPKCFICITKKRRVLVECAIDQLRRPVQCIPTKSAAGH